VFNSYNPNVKGKLKVSIAVLFAEREVVGLLTSMVARFSISTPPDSESSNSPVRVNAGGLASPDDVGFGLGGFLATHRDIKVERHSLRDRNRAIPRRNHSQSTHGLDRERVNSLGTLKRCPSRIFNKAETVGSKGQWEARSRGPSPNTYNLTQPDLHWVKDKGKMVGGRRRGIWAQQQEDLRDRN
jgi:hypothetical protein